jgi:hypothetical protein
MIPFVIKRLNGDEGQRTSARDWLPSVMLRRDFMRWRWHHRWSAVEVSEKMWNILRSNFIYFSVLSIFISPLSPRHTYPHTGLSPSFFVSLGLSVSKPPSLFSLHLRHLLRFHISGVTMMTPFHREYEPSAITDPIQPQFKPAIFFLFF